VGLFKSQKQQQLVVVVVLVVLQCPYLQVQRLYKHQQYQQLQVVWLGRLGL
jgi:hypothetical protein